MAVIAGIYLIKNPPVSQQESDGIEEAAVPEGGADFSLAATEAIDFEMMSSYGLPMIIDYGSDSCIPCKQMAPVLETMNREIDNSEERTEQRPWCLVGRSYTVLLLFNNPGAGRLV